MNIIEIFNETSKEIPEIKELKKFVKYALKHENLDNVEFGIIFVDNKKIKKLNKEHRNKDSITDVISFAMEDYKPVLYDKIRVLGDVYISIDKAISQAEDYEHSLLREISFLSIHGLLHLLGYNHIDIKDEEKMFEKQKEILDSYGIKR